MTTRERKLAYRTALWGAALTLLVVLLSELGALDGLERWGYDRRARGCQFFAVPPSDRLVHLDIDDAALEVIGPWPWPRSQLAQVVEELHQAGAKAVGLDVLFAEHQPPRAARLPDGRPGAWIEDDQVLAQALAHSGCAVAPASFAVRADEAPWRQALIEELVADLELPREQVLERLRQRGFAALTLDDLLQDDALNRARPKAMRVRIERELPPDPAATQPSLAQLRRRLLPRTAEAVTRNELLAMLARQYDRALAERALRRHSLPPAPELPAPLPVEMTLAPIAPLAQAAAATGSVYYQPDADGVVRNVALWVEYDGRLYPQFALALACLMLDVPLERVRLEADRTIIPRPGGRDLVIPVRQRRFAALGGRDAGFFVDVPWFGPGDWTRMYGLDAAGLPNQHVPISQVWRLAQIREQIENNNRTLDDALRFVLRLLSEEKLRQYAATQPALHDTRARLPVAEWALKELAASGWVQAVRDIPATQRSRDDLDLLRSEADLRAIPALNAELEQLLLEGRARLRAQTGGKAVIVGWTATGAAADFVPTSLHARCPGAVVHGVILSGILTGELFRTASPGANMLATLLIGALATCAAAALSPFRSLLAALVLAGGFVLFNGIVLYDRYNLILGLAGPTVAVVLVWTGGTLFRFVLERRERARITQRFRSYVDPALVHYVIEHPDQAQLSGQEREMTVVFTDLAGFTPITERLKERTVEVLNQYTELMVPVITEQHGFVNKFLGDGIMFFYGAPEPDADHARHALVTVLRMLEVLPRFNAQLKARGLPGLTMRAGVSTGTMIVGDAGGAHRSDYTVLGDAVNLGARLEGANKATGTLILATQRTLELAGGRDGAFLVRPIGCVQVVGKTQGVMTFEPLALRDQATDRQKALADRTRAMVEAFLAGDFRACRDAAAALDAAFGDSKLAALYRELCEEHLRTGPPEPFTGTIVLHEK